MSEHDKIRLDRAMSCDRSSILSLNDAIVGLQSTDDPSLGPLHDELVARLVELEFGSEPEEVLNRAACLQLFIEKNKWDVDWYVETKVMTVNGMSPCWCCKAPIDPDEARRRTAGMSFTNRQPAPGSFGAQARYFSGMPQASTAQARDNNPSTVHITRPPGLELGQGDWLWLCQACWWQLHDYRSDHDGTHIGGATGPGGDMP